MNPPHRPYIQLWILLGLVAALMLLAVLVFPVLARTHQSAYDAKCLSNIKTIALGIMTYSRDWDGCYPPSASWRDAMASKVKGPEELWRCPFSPKGYGYALNELLGGKSEARLAKSEKVVLLFEMDAPGNATGRLGQVVYRHPMSAVFAFADGHCKAVYTDAVPSLTWTPSPAQAAEEPREAFR